MHILSVQEDLLLEGFKHKIVERVLSQPNFRTVNGQRILIGHVLFSNENFKFNGRNLNGGVHCLVEYSLSQKELHYRVHLMSGGDIKNLTDVNGAHIESEKAGLLPYHPDLKNLGNALTTIAVGFLDNAARVLDMHKVSYATVGQAKPFLGGIQHMNTKPLIYEDFDVFKNWYVLLGLKDLGTCSIHADTDNDIFKLYTMEEDFELKLNYKNSSVQPTSLLNSLKLVEKLLSDNQAKVQAYELP